MWLDDDRDLAVEFHSAKSEICDACGTRPAEWLTPQGKLRIPPPYVVDVVDCEGCRNLAGEQREDPMLQNADEGRKLRYRAYDPERDSPEMIAEREERAEQRRLGASS